MAKSDRQIVEEVNAVAMIVLRYMGTGYVFLPDHRFWEATDPRSRKAWAGAVEIYERITGTEVHDALDGFLDHDVLLLSEGDSHDNPR